EGGGAEQANPGGVADRVGAWAAVLPLRGPARDELRGRFGARGRNPRARARQDDPRDERAERRDRRQLEGALVAVERAPADDLADVVDPVRRVEGPARVLR